MVVAAEMNGIDLAAEVRTARALLDCLQAEQALLVQGDAAAVAEKTEQKSAILVQIGTLMSARVQAVQAAGYPATVDGMHDWVSRQEAGVQQAWQELMQVAAAGKEFNRTNGILIRQHLGRIKSNLQALQGEGGHPAVYGRDGQQDMGSMKRVIVAG